MTSLNDFQVGIIGDRINPGFKSTKVLFDNDDIAGIQALAVKQVEAGAKYLDVNVGARGETDAALVAKVTRAIQAAVTVPGTADANAFKAAFVIGGHDTFATERIL